jgi:hypothetical protein
VRRKSRTAARAVTEILDLSDRAIAKKLITSARYGRTRRWKTVGVTLPQLSIYDGEAVYHDGRLVIAGVTVRVRDV